MGVVLMNATYSHPDINRARTLLEPAHGAGWRKTQPSIAHVAVISIVGNTSIAWRRRHGTLLHLDPTSLDGRYGLGQVYALLDKPEQSRQQLEQYKVLDERQRRVTRLSEEAIHHPLSADAHAALAHYLEASGDFARALPQYQTAVSLEPNSTALWQEVTRFYARLGWAPPARGIQ